MRYRARPRGPDSLLLAWDDEEGKVVPGGNCFGCRSLGALLRHLDWLEFQIRAEQAVLDTPLSADVVRREGASTAELLADIERELAEKFGQRISFAIRTETQRTIVLRGSVGQVLEDRPVEVLSIRRVAS